MKKHIYSLILSGVVFTTNLSPVVAMERENPRVPSVQSKNLQQKIADRDLSTDEFIGVVRFTLRMFKVKADDSWDKRPFYPTELLKLLCYNYYQGEFQSLILDSEKRASKKISFEELENFLVQATKEPEMVPMPDQQVDFASKKGMLAALPSQLRHCCGKATQQGEKLNCERVQRLYLTEKEDQKRNDFIQDTAREAFRKVLPEIMNQEQADALMDLPSPLLENLREGLKHLKRRGVEIARRIPDASDNHPISIDPTMASYIAARLKPNTLSELLTEEADNLRFLFGIPQ